MVADTRRIPLRVSNKKAYVWDVDDIAVIRSQHGICGILTGTLPHLSQQNAFLGIPLVLMPEEAVYLIENGVATFVDDTRAHIQPSTSELKQWNADQQENIKQQLALAEIKTTKDTTSGRAMSEEAIRKRKEREEKKREKAARLAAKADGPNALLAPTLEVEAPKVDAAHISPGRLSSSTVPYTIVIPALSSTFEWYDPSKYTYTTLGDAKTAGIWDYPATLAERARCGVFRGLKEKGFFMGGGIKFGGEYLVYPGDPLRYHSHFAASVLESPIASLRPMEIVAHGRLGTATKKAHLLCGWDDEKKEVSYLSIEWAGFG
ncbi:hypothetical protein BDQ12DRAFT_703294 [Crucibulum laeve]|uniref:tRNA-splicing endonuclease subunit Sen34 n=1 Tax=Crucibulum laeve TaxID=68775 RepID=A0A5C3MC07_9AGAR|nr:hypothetical protein BDQ12DRAFT_703294 [Crucibulum laeve]